MLFVFRGQLPRRAWRYFKGRLFYEADTSPHSADQH